jgi:hypothetical protein
MHADAATRGGEPRMATMRSAWDSVRAVELAREATEASDKRVSTPVCMAFAGGHRFEELGRREAAVLEYLKTIWGVVPFSRRGGYFFAATC